MCIRDRDTALEMANNGASAKDIVKLIVQSRMQEESYLVPVDFQFLVRGGRTVSYTHLIEEVGSMNVMFEIDNKIVTAPCEGTVLPGVTRD